jgi:hypothetical protein
MSTSTDKTTTTTPITNSDLLKQELNNLKTKLEEIEIQLDEKLNEINIREEKWKEMEDQVNHVIQTNQEQIVKFNVGGKKFATCISSLNRIPNTLFYKLSNSNRFDFSQEIFIDRSPRLFPYILDYLRGNGINYPRFSIEEIEELSLEAEYYEMADICHHLQEIKKEVDFVKFESNGTYNYSGAPVGTNRVEDLKDISATKGITANSPGWILIEFNREWEFDEIDISGYNGNTTAWYPGNGSGAQIQTSTNKTNWKTVGTLPSNYGATVNNVKLTRSSAKYIKFVGTSYLGIGYLKIKKIK